MVIIGTIAFFGIGTSLSNDFKSISSGRKQKNKALNMVIKLYQVDGKFCAKISDELTKVRIWLCSSSYAVIVETPQNTGNKEAIRQAKEVFGINV